MTREPDPGEEAASEGAADDAGDGDEAGHPAGAPPADAGDEPLPAPVAVAGLRAHVPDPEAALEAVGRVRRDLADAAPEALRSERGALIQVADARAVCGADHLRGAARRAVAARQAGTGVADDPALDVLLYAAGVRQIQEALAVLGLPEGAEAVAVVAVHPDPEAAVEAVADALDGDRDDTVLDPSEEALERLGVPEAQRRAVDPGRWTDLALEHGALLEVDK